MKQRFRLTRSNDFKRVRNQGKSFAHPLLVLVRLKSDEDRVRIGISTSRAVGNAVKRNRAKRLIKESIRPFIPSIRKGYDLVLIARNRLLDSEFSEIQITIEGLLMRAELLAFEQNPTIAK
ncbi:MAG: ribonuclease P protein component [Chloroflexota bacterium]